MVKRTVNAGEGEPEQKQFDLPSEKEHLFQVVDVFTSSDEMGVKLGLDDNTVSAKLEVVGGEEQGRTLLCRLSLDPSWKGFFATRLFLKAIGMDYKGADLVIDSDMWVGNQVYATVVHNGKFANIDTFNFDKKVEQPKKFVPGVSVTDPKDIAWED